MQRPLYPIRIISFRAYAPISTVIPVDSSYMGTGEDGHDYILKESIPHNKFQPVNEWFGYNFARQLGIPTPDFEIVEFNDNPVFGSRYVIAEPQAIFSQLLQGANLPTNQDIPHVLSQIITLDCFLGNVDRSPTNLLCVEADGYYQLIAIDFGRSYNFGQWPPTTVIPSDCVTMKVYEGLKTKEVYSPFAIENTLQNIRETPVDIVLNIIDSAPEQWKSAQLRHKMKVWWGSSQFNKLLIEIDQKLR